MEQAVVPTRVLDRSAPLASDAPLIRATHSMSVREALVEAHVQAMRKRYADKHAPKLDVLPPRPRIASMVGQREPGSDPSTPGAATMPGMPKKLCYEALMWGRAIGIKLVLLEGFAGVWQHEAPT